jgi:hypothetical protein
LEQLANSPISTLALCPVTTNRYTQYSYWVDKNLYDYDSAIAVFNVEGWAKLPFLELLEQYAHITNGAATTGNQGILNAVNRKLITDLDPIYHFYPHLLGLNPALYLPLIGLRNRKFIDQETNIVKHPETAVIIDAGPFYGWKFYYQLEGNLDPYAEKWHKYLKDTPFYGECTLPSGQNLHAWVRYLPRSVRTIGAAMYSYRNYRNAKKMVQEFALKLREVAPKIDPEHKYFIG